MFPFLHFINVETRSRFFDSARTMDFSMVVSSPVSISASINRIYLRLYFSWVSLWPPMKADENLLIADTTA